MPTFINFKWSLHVILKNGFHLFYEKLSPIDRKVKFDKMDIRNYLQLTEKWKFDKMES